MYAAEQCREILLLGDPIPLDCLLVGRELGRHGVDIGALKLDRAPPCLSHLESVKQLREAVRSGTSSSCCGRTALTRRS